MSFSGILDRRALRTFHRSLHCLLRIGAELTLECKRDQLLLRTLAASHAAYVLLTIKNTFFMIDTFKNTDTAGHIIPLHPVDTQPSPSSSSFLKCKLHLKQMMLLFRHLVHSADQMEINIEAKDNKLWATAAIHGVKSKYGIPFESQTNILQADFPRSRASNLLLFKPSLLARAFDHFPPKLEEISLLIFPLSDSASENDVPEIIKFKSYNAELAAAQQAAAAAQQQGGAAAAAAAAAATATITSGGMAQLLDLPETETTIPTNQLESMNFTSSVRAEGCELTFNMKEVRAFLSYVDSLGEYDVAVRWLEQGQPMLFETQLRHATAMGNSEAEQQTAWEEAKGAVHMELVVATLMQPVIPRTQSQHSQQQQQSQSQQPSSSQQQQQPSASQQARATQQQIASSFQQKQSAAAPTNVNEEEEANQQVGATQ